MFTKHAVGDAPDCPLLNKRLSIETGNTDQVAPIDQSVFVLLSYHEPTLLPSYQGAAQIFEFREFVRV